jgi:hypothetical protein
VRVPPAGRALAILPLLVLLILGLAGCTPLTGYDQVIVVQPPTLELGGASTVGQSLMTRHAGLMGVEVYLGPERAGSGDLRLHLRKGPRAATDLETATLPIASVSSAGFYRFVLAPRGIAGEDLFILLDVMGEGAVRVGAGPGASYLNGALYKDGVAQDAQMAFRLVYAPQPVALGLAREALGWLGLLGVTLALFVLPGWALLALWPRAAALSWPERLGIAAGLSVGVYSLLLLFTDLVGLHLGALYVWLTLAVAVTSLVWRNRAWRPSAPVAVWRAWRQGGALWPDLALLAALSLVFVVRFYVVRLLDVPLWGDSYQHTMVAQLLVDNGGLFSSWEPYARMQSLTYHFGFQTAAAVLAWFASAFGAPNVPQAVLWTGQILNGLAVLALYPLAARVGGNRWAGVAAVVVAGLLSPMPMFYVNWGRYTQLAGQVVLPAAVCLSWLALESETGRRRWALFLLASLALGGLALTHYRVLILASLFFAAFLLTEIRGGRFRTALAGTAVLGAGGGLIFLPWFVHVYGGSILRNFGAKLATPATQVSESTQAYNAIGDLAAYLPLPLWILLAGALSWGLWRRNKPAALVGIWWLLLLLAANPQWLGLPGTGALSSSAVLIAAYIPAAVLLGGAAGWIIEALQVQAGRWRPIAATLLVLGVSLWGARDRLADLKVSTYALVTRPDLRAAAWIQQNTPAKARFLVNSFSAFDNSSIVGSDGGWWLPLLAHRDSTLPPLLYASESGPTPDYREWVNALSRAIQQTGLEDPGVLAMLKERGVTHVYLGQQQGTVGYNGPMTLHPAQLTASPRFKAVYHEDRVWVFEVVW